MSTEQPKSTPIITTAPCGKCPFRKDVPIYLRASRRAEIARSLLRGGDFPCHNTVAYRDVDEKGEEIPDLSKATFCAGAAKSLLEAGMDNQILRVMERLGMVNLNEVARRGPEVWDIHTWQSLTEGVTAETYQDDEEEEIAVCVNSDSNCLAPAGWLEGGGVVYGTEKADGRCESCEEPLCSECADENGHCSMCSSAHEY